MSERADLANVVASDGAEAGIDQMFDDMRRARRGPGLRWQILLTLAVLFAVTVVLVGVAASRVIRHIPEQQKVESGLTSTHLLATSLAAVRDADGGDDAQTPRMKAVVDAAATSRAILRLEVVDDAGHVVLRAPERIDRADELPIAFSTVLSEGGPQHFLRGDGRGGRQLVAQQPLCAPGGGACSGAVGAVFSMNEVDANINASRNLMWLYLAIAALLMLVVGYVMLTRRVVRPLGEIAAGTRQLAMGDYDHRIKVKDTGEVGQLAVEFNVMARRLREHRVALIAKVEELERANHELGVAQRSLVRSEKLATVGRLAAGVAHEVGNPLSAVLGYMELLQGGDLDREDERDLLTRIDREVHRIDGIIRELLDYSRADRIAIGAHRLVDVVVGAIHLVEAQPRFNDITLTVDEDSLKALPLVRLHPGRMQQVMVNLLLNAADAMDDGVGAITLTAERAPDADLVELHVRDDGVGIPADQVEHIFEPFFTTKEPGKGTGLGLAICYSIVTSFGGQLAVASTVGEGTVFTVRVPVEPAVDDMEQGAS